MQIVWIVVVLLALLTYALGMLMPDTVGMWMLRGVGNLFGSMLPHPHKAAPQGLNQLLLWGCIILAAILAYRLITRGISLLLSLVFVNTVTLIVSALVFIGLLELNPDTSPLMLLAETVIVMIVLGLVLMVSRRAANRESKTTRSG